MIKKNLAGLCLGRGLSFVEDGRSLAPQIPQANDNFEKIIAIFCRTQKIRASRRM